MKTIFKIILFPIALTARLLALVIDIMANVSAYIMGPFVLFVVAGALVCAFRQSWLNVGILTGFFVAIQAVYFASAIVANVLKDIYGSWTRI